MLKELSDFLTFAANPIHLQAYLKGADVGSKVAKAIGTDVHEIAKASSNSEQGAAIGLLKLAFPRSAEALAAGLKELEEMEDRLFPVAPEEGIQYWGKVENVSFADKTVLIKVEGLRPRTILTMPLRAYRALNDEFFATIEREEGALVALQYKESGWVFKI